MPHTTHGLDWKSLFPACLGKTDPDACMQVAKAGISEMKEIERQNHTKLHLPNLPTLNNWMTGSWERGPNIRAFPGMLNLLHHLSESGKIVNKDPYDALVSALETKAIEQGEKEQKRFLFELKNIPEPLEPSYKQADFSRLMLKFMRQERSQQQSLSYYEGAYEIFRPSYRGSSEDGSRSIVYHQEFIYINASVTHNSIMIVNSGIVMPGQVFFADAKMAILLFAGQQANAQGGIRALIIGLTPDKQKWSSGVLIRTYQNTETPQAAPVVMRRIASPKVSFDQSNYPKHSPVSKNYLEQHGIHVGEFTVTDKDRENKDLNIFSISEFLEKLFLHTDGAGNFLHLAIEPFSHDELIGAWNTAQSDAKKEIDRIGGNVISLSDWEKHEN